MSTVIYYSISLAVVIAFGLGYIFWGRKKENNQQLYFKILSSVLAIIFVLRYMSGDDLIEQATRLEFAELGSPALTFISLIVNWFMIGIELLLILFPFFDKNYTKNIIKFFALPVCVISMFFMTFAIKGIVGVGGYEAFNFRAILAF